MIGILKECWKKVEVKSVSPESIFSSGWYISNLYWYVTDQVFFQGPVGKCQLKELIFGIIMKQSQMLVPSFWLDNFTNGC